MMINEWLKSIKKEVDQNTYDRHIDTISAITDWIIKEHHHGKRARKNLSVPINQEEVSLLKRGAE